MTYLEEVWGFIKVVLGFITKLICCLAEAETSMGDDD